MSVGTIFLAGMAAGALMMAALACLIAAAMLKMSEEALSEGGDVGDDRA
ncbi:MAG: hypothetical protein QHC65_04155 [Sphingomonas sp.]|nr:hypothetical protein [Sphingomonas sp.]MDX3883591.1 hypothetical protein [Sphingomonas sp.]